MPKISVVISAFNEEKNLFRCLESVKDLATEIIVIDNESTDQTTEIAQKFGAVIFSQPNNQMLNINKNYGFEKATGDWILNLDADEELSPELKEEIKAIINQSTNNGYSFPRKNIIFGKWIQHSLWWPDFQLRLFKKGFGKFPEKHVHEYLEVQGKTARLQFPLIHHNYQTISQFLYKMDQIYTESEVQRLLKDKKDLKWQEIIKASPSDFLKNYFSLNGYKDGQHGLILNLLQSFTPLMAFAKVWEKQGFPGKEISYAELSREIKKIIKEINYWLLTTEIDQTKNPLKIILLKLKRKLLQI